LSGLGFGGASPSPKVLICQKFALTFFKEALTFFNKIKEALTFFNKINEIILPCY